MIIDVDAMTTSAAREQILTLMRRRTVICEHARALSIYSSGQLPLEPGKWYDPTIFIWNDMRELLGSAIESMQNLTSVSW